MRSRALVFLVVLFFCLPVYSNSNDDDRLKFDLYLYFWLASTNGKVIVGTHSSDASMKFGDILQSLKMEANGAFKISKRDWFLFNDFMYLDVAPKTNENIAPDTSINTTTDTTTFTDMLVVGQQWHEPVSWSAFIGARYFYGKIKLDTTVADTTSLQAVGSRKWFTPTIGAEIKLPLSDKVFLNVIADIGATNRSFNWGVLPTFCLQFNTMFAAKIGYRVLDMRHKEDDFKMDTTIHGPIVGLKISF